MRTSLLVVLVGLCATMPGCTLGLAPIASVANFGYAAWTGSRLKFVEDASFENVSMAAERALVGLDLRVELTTEMTSEGIVRTRVYQIRSERGDLAILRLVRLSSTMTNVSLDMGILGNRPAGELIADHIRWYTDGDTIRASRRAAMEGVPGAAEPGEGSEPTDKSSPDSGRDFGQGLL